MVLFGSQARGGSDRLSDIDLLVVVTGLPLEWRERKKHLRAIKSRLDVDGRLEIFLVDPEEIKSALANASPLMFDIHDAHRLIHDPQAFFAQEMKEFAVNLKSWQARKRAEGVWEVIFPSHLDTQRAVRPRRCRSSSVTGAEGLRPGRRSP